MLSLKATLICCLFGFGLFSFARQMRLIRKTFEERLQRTTDPIQRSSLEYSIEQMKLKSDNSFLSIQELRNQEYKISNQLQMEQNRLNEFNDRLDAIQREIEAQLIKPER